MIVFIILGIVVVLLVIILVVMWWVANRESMLIGGPFPAYGRLSLGSYNPDMYPSEIVRNV